MYDLDPMDDYEVSDVVAEPAEVDPQERLVTAALLTATAFRLKDAEGLVYALRQLVAAVGGCTGARYRN